MPTDRHTTIPNYSGPISVCFDDDPELYSLRASSAESSKPSNDASDKYAARTLVVAMNG